MVSAENPFLVFVGTVLSIAVIAVFIFNAYPVPITGASISFTALGFSVWGLPLLVVVGIIIRIGKKNKGDSDSKPWKVFSQ